MKIGIFDSGLGGLTVLNKAIEKIGPCKYIYMADNANTPYGVKDKDIVKQYIFKCIKSLLEYNCDVVVIACNTATSIAIDDLRTIYPNKIIIGTEPAVKVAVQKNMPDKRILVCATSITVKEEKLSNLVKRLNAENKVDFVALDELVEYIENDTIDNAKIEEYIRSKITEFDKDDYDFVVLGCTHFPILKKNFENVFSQNVKIIDGSDGIVRNIMSKIDWKNVKKEEKTNLSLILTKESKLFVKNFKRISNIKEFTIYVS